ncbi:MAG: endonuclease dU [Candidatus Njordarchaeales archaeon]
MKEKRRISIYKKGFRILGIAESFKKEYFPHFDKSVIAGVIVRGDLQVDGFAFNFITVRGLDATEKIIELYRMMSRPDISIIMLSGTVIALYNVIDLNKLYDDIKKPIIAVTYEESKGIERFLLELPDGEERVRIHHRNGPRIPILLKNSFRVFIRPVGISIDEAVYVLNRFTIHGRYPEPVRLARILARALLSYIFNKREELCGILSKLCRDKMGNV